MSPLWRYKATHKQLNKIKPSPAYQSEQFKDKSLARDSNPLKFKQNKASIKGISLFICQTGTWWKGSMTVEAAAVLPLLLFFFLNLTSVIEMIRLHGNLELALWDTGRRMAIYEYAFETLGDKLQEKLESQEEDSMDGLASAAMSAVYARSEVIRFAGKDYLDTSPLTHGAVGLNFLETVVQKEEDRIELLVTYQVSPFLSVPGLSSFRMANRFYAKPWTGYRIPGAEQEQDDYVYVTEYGEVYHETTECTYIKRYIREVSIFNIAAVTNSRGERYTLCWLCREKTPDNIVYITTDGVRYHYSKECSVLKRTIRELPKKEAQKQYRPCSKCAS